MESARRVRVRAFHHNGFGFAFAADRRGHDFGGGAERGQPLQRVRQVRHERGRQHRRRRERTQSGQPRRQHRAEERAAIDESTRVVLRNRRGVRLKATDQTAHVRQHLRAETDQSAEHPLLRRAVGRQRSGAEQIELNGVQQTHHRALVTSDLQTEERKGNT